MKRVGFEGLQYRRDIANGAPTPIAVLASGRGSNFEAILRAIQAGKLKCTRRCRCERSCASACS